MLYLSCLSVSIQKSTPNSPSLGTIWWVLHSCTTNLIWCTLEGASHLCNNTLWSARTYSTVSLYTRPTATGVTHSKVPPLHWQHFLLPDAQSESALHWSSTSVLTHGLLRCFRQLPGLDLVSAQCTKCNACDWTMQNKGKCLQYLLSVIDPDRSHCSHLLRTWWVIARKQGGNTQKSDIDACDRKNRPNSHASLSPWRVT